MTTTILTDEQIAQALNLSGATDYADVPLSYDLEIARTIEQAVLQSPEIKALREDAERLNWIEEQFGAEIGYGDRNEWWVDWSEGYVEATSMRDAIDAALEKLFLKH